MKHQRTLVARTPTELADRLARLSAGRQRVKSVRKAKAPKRRSLSRSERERVLAKTGRRCHICGGEIDGAWNADHVLAHSGGGEHSVENYLPAHGLCNNYRWDYAAEEFQLILKLGVWCRTQIEKPTGLWRKVAAAFITYEAARLKRQKS